MLSCWQRFPESRPLFNNLEESLSRIMDQGVSEHYISLNEPYLLSNASQFESGNTDYYALMSSPDLPSPSIPKNTVMTKPRFPILSSMLLHNNPIYNDQALKIN